MDADLILLSDNSDGQLSTLTDKPLWKNLSAVKAGRVIQYTNKGDSYVLDGTEHQGNLAWALARTPGPIANKWVLERFLPVLSKALES